MQLIPATDKVGESAASAAESGRSRRTACGAYTIGTLLFVALGSGACHSGVRPPDSRGSRLDAVEGDVVCRPDGTPWAPKGSEAILIMASGTCGSCQADIPFEEKLWENAQDQAIPVYYVLANRDSNHTRIAELRSGGRTVITVQSLQQFGIARTPTVARVDASGRILSKWTGNVLRNDFDRVLDSVVHGAGLQQYQRISEDEMSKRVATTHAQVLAFSETRDLSVPAKIIPPAEVYVRAKREMNPRGSIVIDCTKTRDILSCQDAALELKMADFGEVAVAGLETRPTPPCGGKK